MAIEGEIKKIGDAVTYTYSGSIQEFIVPVTGLYKLEVWGAKGGNSKRSGIGGSGGYSKGHTILKEGTQLYVVAGGGTYNGGGTVVPGSEAGYGGGATHIALRTGLLSTLNNHLNDVLIIAGGGGGGGAVAQSDINRYNANGGAGGGISGYAGRSGDIGANLAGGSGGTQNKMGSSGNANGLGETGGGFGCASQLIITSDPWAGHAKTAGAGGGGLYGGGHGGVYGGGGGGSGYIDGVPELIYKGTTYTPETQNGMNNEQNGRAVITLVDAEQGFTSLYLGDKPVSELYLGEKEVTDLFIGDISLK